MMSTQEDLIKSGNLTRAEIVLERGVSYSSELANQGYSLDYLVESGMALAELYELEGRVSESIEMYKYINSILRDSDYKLKGNINVKINRLDSILQNQYQSKLVQMENYNNYLTEKSKPKNYDGTNLLMVQDIITTVDNIIYTLRY